MKQETGGLGIFDDWTQPSIIFKYTPQISVDKNLMKEHSISHEKLGTCAVKLWTPESALIIHQTLEIHNWAPWLAASKTSLIGRSLIFPEGQLFIELPSGVIVASVSTNRIHWDGQVDHLPNWDTVAGEPTTYENTYKSDGNTLTLMSMNVHPSYQKFGLATALVHQTQEIGKTLGVEYIVGSFRPNEFGMFKAIHGTFRLWRIY